ncbi:carbohydrate kinase family protein [Streptacidiphilus pinicola]|uniref:carbohydrate kinase family protein n=1 Tax=Streptacidiphilus pinicola TaxID=2219663 RepID=UPI001FB4F835|nr:carbohydrate kinase [Streptacidiphilus pinicola]
MTPPRDNTAAHPGPVVTVIGEALIDMVPGERPGDFRALPGGSPFNVAVGLARLGRRTSLMARLADNAFGRLLRAHAEAEGIDLSHAPRATEPTSLAIVSLNEHAQAHYDFYLDGTADWQWSAAETTRLPPGTAVLHHGSLASWTAPGDEHIHALATRLHAGGQGLVSYDPNIRPLLLGGHDKARPLVERSITAAHVVKASREDVEWLYPDTSLEEIGRHWLALGALLVVITDGPDGAHLFRHGEPTLSRPGRKAAVADTVGAGDSFTAAFLDALVRHDLHTPERLQQSTLAALLPAADDAILVSSLTCERIGANPPRLLPRPDSLAPAPLTRGDLHFG